MVASTAIKKQNMLPISGLYTGNLKRLFEALSKLKINDIL